MDIAHSDILAKIEDLSKSEKSSDLMLARQMMFSLLPSSSFVERYLEDNEGRLQSLNNFPMLRPIYDHKPQKLLLKCSRKVLKSTWVSNYICLNMIRWRRYKMMYLGPQEMSVKYFSANYLKPRFDSARIKTILPKGLSKDDVFEKTLEETGSSVILRFVKDDATRIRGPATDENFHDEVQDINHETIPIIRETLALSPYKRESFQGTPLTTDNTINTLWLDSTMFEWAMRCDCGHWNTLTEDNEPFKMMSEKGLCCSKCSRILNSRGGEWVRFNLGKTDLAGFHLAQPLLPHFNENPKEWKEFYTKITGRNQDICKVYNESFGLAYDIGTKPITVQELQALCKLGPMGDLDLVHRNKSKYMYFTMGVDWGVNMITSRTVVTLTGQTADGRIDIVWCKIFEGLEYESHIRQIADVANQFQAFVVCDGGPDAQRGHRLAELTSPHRTQLTRYEHGKLIQRTDMPTDAPDWRASRWILHRSDTLTKVFKMLKNQEIQFPGWDDVSEYMQDILNVYIEVKQGIYREEIFYRHQPTKPDDAIHSLNWAIMAQLMLRNDLSLQGSSTSAFNGMADWNT